MGYYHPNTAFFSPFSKTSKLFICISCLIFLLLDVHTSSAKSKLNGIESDRYSLLAFKAMITDDPLKVMSSWNDSISYCQWPGVSCGRRHRRVTALNLSSLQLVGSVAPHIGNLSLLRVLKLQNNSFSNEIPSELGHLQRLQILQLNNNSFTGKVPPNISSCSDLIDMNLSNNRLVGNIPAEFGRLTKLQRILLVSNNFTGDIPLSFGNLSSLQGFFASKNHFSGQIPDQVCHLLHLSFFVVNENEFTGTLPPSLFNHSSMRAIDVGTNRIHGILPHDLGLTLPSLQFFSIYRNNFSCPIPSSLSNATNLEFLVAGRNGLTGRVPPLDNLNRVQRFLIAFNQLGTGEASDLSFLSTLTNATNLELLEINQNNFGGILPKCICNLSKFLIEISMSYNQISGNIPERISNLQSLQGFYAAHNQLSGEIPVEICKLSRLQELALLENKFSGEIPFCIGNLTLLNKLSLRENYLQGSVPPSLGRCRYLELLELNQNNLSGPIPKEVIGLPSLSRTLDLSQNQFTGSLPAEVGNLNNIGLLDLSVNNLSGHIPAALGSCVSLEYLSLKNNSFEGTVPSTLASLRGIQYLDLSNNNISGEIPKFFEDFEFLQHLDLSYNNLEGAVPLEGIFQNATAVSVEGNSNLCGGIPELHLALCKVKVPPDRKSTTIKIAIGLACGISGLTLLFCYLYLRSFRTKHPAQLVENYGSSISYQSLIKATDGFSPSNLVGSGGFGTVYKGVLDNSGKLVAIKVLNLLHCGASRSFIAECNILRNVRHRNLVKVLTACSSVDNQGNDFKAIVYQYMENGSLEEWLHRSAGNNPPDEELKKLDFLQRLNTAIDIASALDYLHNNIQSAIVHCDLKPSNILLDGNMTAHVSDFGLARFLQPAISDASEVHDISSAVRGSIGYIPPEYGMRSEASKEGDMYSYGILLLELFTGKRPTHEMFKESLNLHNYVKAALPDGLSEIIDPILIQKSEEVEESMAETGWEDRTSDGHQDLLQCLHQVIGIGLACSVESPMERKNASDVAVELRSIRKSYLRVLRCRVDLSLI